jgi:predicted MPP superfamily phosphohydrolase
MGLSTLLFIYLLAADILLLRTWVDPFWVTAGVLAIAGVSTAGGLLQARRPSVVKVEVPIAHLHGDLERFRIVQLSDLHVGPTLRRSFVERVVDTANGLAPDLVVLTGDVADGMPHQVRHDVAPLARLTAPQGKFFVTGNHEYYWDAPGWVREVEQLGFQALINSHRVIEEGGATMIVAGVTDRSTGGVTPGHRHDTGAALAGAPVANVKLLLAHQPTSAYEAQRAGFDLQLSGHTHGGQYFPFSLLVRLFQPFVAGLHRLEQMWLYVSRGTGYWGPPLRLGAPAEITLIELVRA